MKLVDFYRAYLTSVGAYADQDGLLSFDGFGVTKPLMIDDKRLALPTPSVLKAVGRGEDIVPFHPLSESSNRGESTVLQMLKQLIRMRLSSSIMGIFTELVELCANKKRHKKLSAKAHRVLSCLPEADEKTLDAVERIIKACSADSARSMGIYLKRQGKIDGKVYSRVAVFKLPLYEEFEDDEAVVFGVKLRKKDYYGLKELLEYILPDLARPNGQMIGTNHLLVPYLDCLTKCYVRLAQQINQVYHVHKADLPEEYHIDLSWVDDDGELDWKAWKDEIVPLEDSMGVVIGTETQPQSKLPKPSIPENAFEVRSPPAVEQPPWNPAPPAPQPAPPAPRYQTPPMGQPKRKSIDDVLNERYGAPPQPQVPAYPPGYPPSVPGGYGAPPMAPQPAYHPLPGQRYMGAYPPGPAMPMVPGMAAPYYQPTYLPPQPQGLPYHQTTRI